MMVIDLRHFSVDTASSTYFSPFPSRTLPRSTRTMTDSGQLRSSISLPGCHVDFFTFAEHVSFEHTTGSRWPVIYSGREGNINKQTYKTQKFSSHSIVDQAVRIALLMPVFGRSAANARSDAGAATFRSNRKYRYRPHTQPDVGNCWPCHPEPPHAQSLFLFPLGFGINLIHFFDGKNNLGLGQDWIICLASSITHRTAHAI